MGRADKHTDKQGTYSGLLRRTHLKYTAGRNCMFAAKSAKPTNSHFAGKKTLRISANPKPTTDKLMEGEGARTHL